MPAFCASSIAITIAGTIVTPGSRFERSSFWMSAALALPHQTDSGFPFPYRNLILLVTFSVILVTLLLQGLTLRSLICLVRLPEGRSSEEEQLKARIHAAERVLERLSELESQSAAPQVVVVRVRGYYEDRLTEMKARLEAEGLFDPVRKKGLPAHPRRIGVVTSLAAAALHDVVTSLQRRAPHVEVVVFPSPVQGSEAPAALVAALLQASRHEGVDTLLVCRGGGSLEDLWAFNDESVVRAIADSLIPVVCGVGHETDVTLCDFAADVRAATPTAAAELATDARQDSLNALESLQSRLSRRARHGLDLHAQRLDGCAFRMSRPSRLVAGQSLLIATVGQRLSTSMRMRVDRAGPSLNEGAARLRRAASVLCAQHAQRLATLEARLLALHPQRVLARGYAWLADDSGAPVLSAKRLHSGDSLAAHLSDGVARVRVDEVVPRDEP